MRATRAKPAPSSNEPAPGLSIVAYRGLGFLERIIVMSSRPKAARRRVLRAEIKRESDAVEFWTEERCFITETANDDGDEAVSIARARVLPGVTTGWHRLDGVTERYIIVSGQGRVEIGAMSPATVGPGDVVRIPVDMPQRITNSGSGDLVFFAVCSPPFHKDCYIRME